MSMWTTIDNFLNKVTMYRLLLYYLGGLLVAAFVIGLFGTLSFHSFALLGSTALLLGACWGINYVLARIFTVPVNHESSIITALILALLITPQFDSYGIVFVLAASGLAMASKYILTIKNVHIFNPAAVAVALTALSAQQSASWWIGTATLLPFVVIGGLLVVRKTQREAMVLSFFGATFIATALFAVFGHNDVVTALTRAATASPVFFLGFVMVTEPLTSPGTTKKQALFGALVGLLVPPQVHIFSVYSSPEIALLVGNIFAFIVNPRARVVPTLTQRVKVATNTYDFVFTTSQPVDYRPGQYMEWTLPHDAVDSRGNRRYLTLASSPTEDTLRVGVKFYTPSSSYKTAMLAMTNHTPIVATQVAGDFVMPRDTTQKLVFIAGGIGVTPFRSMVTYLLDTHEQRDVTMLYAAHSRGDIAYRDVFERARTQLGMATTYIVSSRSEQESELPVSQHPYWRDGAIDAQTITETIPDYRERLFYISGSHQMVVAVKAALAQLGVPKRHIKTDYFPGYAS